jgi:Raf kinase inhibitor-like YbhB/YbcL family protein
VQKEEIMSRIMIAAGLSALLGGAAAGLEVHTLMVTSPAFSANGAIPAEYTCDGRQASPPLNWSALPANTKSVAILIDDPDAPGGTFEHLILYNLPPAEQALPSQPQKSTAPHGAFALNSKGDAGYAPICPPTGRHRYRFVVLGLDTTLSLPSGARAADVEHAMKGHVIARGELTGTYQREPAKAGAAPMK